MAVSVEMHHTGDSGSQREVAAAIEHVLADRPGDWRVSIVGSHAGSPSSRRNDYVGEKGFVNGPSARLSKYRTDNFSFIYPVISGLSLVDLYTSCIRPER
jgi:hypothetical protein